MQYARPYAVCTAVCRTVHTYGKRVACVTRDAASRELGGGLEAACGLVVYSTMYALKITHQLDIVVSYLEIGAIQFILQ
jgi:hypothetical protein